MSDGLKRVPDGSGLIGDIHIYRPGYEVQKGPACRILPHLKGQIVKTNCCRQITLARECLVEIRLYEWYEPTFLFTCKPKQGHCGGTKAYGASYGY